MLRSLMLGCLWISTMGLARGCFPSEPPPPPPPAKDEDPAARRKMDEILSRWQQKTSGVETVDAQFTRTDGFRVLKMTRRYEGRLVLRDADRGYVHFDQVIDGGPRQFDMRIVRIGDKLCHYAGNCQELLISYLDNWSRDPHRAEVTGWGFAEPFTFHAEGGLAFLVDGGFARAAAEFWLSHDRLPFLFTPRADEVSQRYRFTLVREQPTQYVIKVIPLLPAERWAYTEADLLLNKERLLPDAIRIVSSDGDYKTFVFKSITLNTKVSDKFFEFQPAPKGWRTIDMKKELDRLNGGDASDDVAKKKK